MPRFSRRHSHLHASCSLMYCKVETCLGNGASPPSKLFLTHLDR